MATILELAELSNAVYTGIGFRPFSKSLEVASWRRSWKVRRAMPDAFQILSNAWEIESGRTL